MSILRSIGAVEPAESAVLSGAHRITTPVYRP
jgi:hypothetical protein